MGTLVACGVNLGTTSLYREFICTMDEVYEVMGLGIPPGGPFKELAYEL